MPFATGFDVRTWTGHDQDILAEDLCVDWSPKHAKNQAPVTLDQDPWTHRFAQIGTDRIGTDRIGCFESEAETWWMGWSSRALGLRL